MRLLLMIPITALCLGTATAQNTSKETKPAMEQAPLKDHVCTSACAGGKHMYAHGEKGHECSADCMKMHEGDAMLKDHVCTSACVGGKHMFAPGEKGHACSADCMKMHAGNAMLKDHVCTAACKDGHHMYVHGEKGHVCDAMCKHAKDKRD